MRAYRVKDRKTEAVRIARSVATNQGAELVIKNERGRIERKDSHGRDPRRIRRRRGPTLSSPASISTGSARLHAARMRLGAERSGLIHITPLVGT